MDILSDILHVAGLRRRLLDLHALQPENALRFPCDRSFGLHAVTRGQAFVHAPNLDAPLALQAGDLVLMARGCVHHLSLNAEPPSHSTTVPIATFVGAEPSALPGHSGTQVVSAAYQLWHPPLHPFLRSLPPWFVVRGHSLPQLSPLPLTLGLLDRELGGEGLGATSATHGLLDALFAKAKAQFGEMVSVDSEGLSLPVKARPLTRMIARAFDAYDQTKARHSAAI